MKTIGLLGTRFTMEQDFYKGRLVEHGLEVLIPPEEDREIVHRVIYEELCDGRIEDSSRDEFLRIIDDLIRRGAEGVIEGCTEIAMLVEPKHTQAALYDTTTIHAEEAVTRAIG